MRTIVSFPYRKTITVPIGRAFSILSLYDLLANLIPGVAWIIVTIVLFPVNWLGLSPGAAPGTFAAAVIIFGFIVGHMIQWLGSKIDEKLRERNHDGNDLFSRTMEAVENGNEKSPIGTVTHIEESFWGLAQKRFDLPNDFPKTSELLLLVLSYLETRPATRTFRFQAIHTFHRSMWSVSILSALAATVSLVMIGLELVSNTWLTSILILLASLIGICVFNNRKNKFQKTFLQYVFLDFYQDQTTSESEQPVKSHER